jgi:cytochrome c peroxidase
LWLVLLSNWKPRANTTIIREFVLAEMDFMRLSLEEIKTSTEIEQKKVNYLKARRHYKHIEFFLMGLASRNIKLHINGPLIVKHDFEVTGELYYPNGFQRIEEILYTDSDRGDLNLVLNSMLEEWKNITKYFSEVAFDLSDVLEMHQMQVYRMISLNLSGFDASFCKNNVEEAIWNLEALEQTAKMFAIMPSNRGKAKRARNNLVSEISKAKKFLLSNLNFDGFNRLEFIREYAIELNRCLVIWHDALDIPWTERNFAIHPNNPHYLDPREINFGFFSPFRGDEDKRTKMVELGKILFFDPILSGNGERSCASCHNPEKAFTDGLPKGLANDGKAHIARNTPGLINVAFQQKFFYDGRVFDLERQVFEVVNDHFEMKGDLNELAIILRESSEYKRLFQDAFEGQADTIITSKAIQKCIAAYERSLVGFNSRFDYYLRGSDNLTQREINGYNLFSGKALCGTCHFFPVFNGTVPPEFLDTEFEVIGVPETKAGKELSEDIGKYKVSRQEIHKGAFKTPSVRNISLTAPYMHNGIYDSLEQVLDFYNRGGGIGLGLEVPNQTLPFDSLNLSKIEQADIILFMHTLNDTFQLTSKPLFLPQFEKHAELNLRKVGGTY